MKTIGTNGSLDFPLKIMESMVPLLLNINKAEINDYL
jgi:hypothetical protein